MGDQVSKVQEQQPSGSDHSKNQKQTNKKEKTKCTKCGIKLSKTSFKNRKHLCNSCGGTFCGDCSKKKKLLPFLKKKGPQRVCDNCFVLDHSQDSKNEVLLKIQKRNQAAITIQKIARGYMARKYFKIIRKRTQIVREILETEQNYCTQLGAVVMLYMRPLQENTAIPTKGLSFLKREPLLEPEQRKTLFSVIEVIYGIHCRLEENLEKRVYRWFDSQTIGDVFVEVKDLLKCYVQYVNNYDASLDVLKKLNKKEEWIKFQTAAKKDPLSQRLDLESLLITPIQRIPRYVLLLQDLLKNTPKSHPDYMIIEAALADVKQLADLINKSKKESQLQSDVLRVHNMLKPQFPDLVVPHRKFVFEDEFTKLMESTPVKEGNMKVASKDSKVYRIFLFNDMVLVCKVKKPFYEPKFHMSIEGTTLVNNDVRGVKSSFLMYDEKMSITLSAASPEIKAKFVKAFEEQKGVFEERKRAATVRANTVSSSGKEEAKSPLSIFKGKITSSFLELKKS